MKRNTSAILVVGMALAIVVSTRAQILHNGVGYIDSQYRVDWSQAGLLPENRSGLLPETPVTADHIYVIDPSGDSDQQIATALQRVRSTGGTWVIYFLGGVHRLSSSIVLRQANGDHNIIFRGAGAGATILEFDLGRDGVLFDIAGSEGSPSSITADIQKGDQSFLCGGSFAYNDWVRINEEDRYVYLNEHGCVGQITQIDGTIANGYTIKDAASKTYCTSMNLLARKVFPITNIGIENLTIICTQDEKSTDDGQHYGSGISIKFGYAVNCWVKGIRSLNTPRHHITIDLSSHIEVSGSYLDDACYHGEGSYGYGVVMGYGNTNCLIENNIFERLRHSLGIGTGSNCNVFAYNFSTDQYSTWNGIFHQAADLCLHGRYSYANLYEENLIEWIEADATHSAHGPFNVFVRNKTYDYTEGEWRNIKLWYAPFTSVLGCELWDGNDEAIEIEEGPYPIFDGYGVHNGDMQEHEYFRGNPGARAEATNDDVSYYYSSAPDFMQGMPFPSIGPRAPGYPTPSQDIPAHVRFSSGPLTYLPDPFPLPASSNYQILTSGATLTQVYSDELWTFTEPPLPGLIAGRYVCDGWMLEGTISLPTDYCYFVGWPSTIGYSFANWNDASLFHVSMLSEDGSSMIVRTCFYKILRDELGGQINKWAPWDPTRTAAQAHLYCKRGGTTSGTLTENECWCNTKTLTGDVTVPSGVTLTISPGTEVRVPAGNRITVNGTLIAHGTSDNPITFDKSGSSTWYGIVFEDPSTDNNCILQYCTIWNCSYGAYCNRSSPRIKNCTIGSTYAGISTFYSSAEIRDNSVHLCNNGLWCINSSPQINGNTLLGNQQSPQNWRGINLSMCGDETWIQGNAINGWKGEGIAIYASNPSILSNDIHQNVDDGVDCQGYANPYLEDNDIYSNGLSGIRVNNTSLPDLFNGGNFLAANSSYQMYSAQSTQIDARYNCWEPIPPNIYGNILWQPYSTGCFGSLAMITMAKSAGGGPGVQSDSTTDAQIHFAKGYKHELAKEYAEAVNEYEFVISEYPDSPEAPMALVRLPRCLKKLGRLDAILPYLRTVSTSHPNSVVGGMALLLEAGLLTKDKAYDEALNNHDKIIKKFKNSDLSRDAMFAIWEILFNGKKDEKGARDVLKEFAKLYPDDENVVMMRMAMGEITLEDLSGLEKFTQPGNQNEKDDGAESDLPKSFALAGNYPNPFNPETTIRYEVPEHGKVIIKIFNIQGEEVTTLFDSEQSAGRYAVKWNGTDDRGQAVASAVYLCQVRFKTANVEHVVNDKMLLLR